MHRRTLARALLALAAVAALGCASASQSVRTPSVRRPAGARLESLPADATFSWVLPSRIFERTIPEDDRSSAGEAAQELRESIALVLRGSRWREVPAGTGEFEVTVFVQTRVRTRDVNTASSGEPVPEATLGQRCDPALRDPRLPPCPRTETQTQRRQERYTERIAMLGIMRADGAGFFHETRFLRIDPAADALSEALVRAMMARSPR